VRRDARVAAWWIRPIAAFLVRREVRVLRRLSGEGIEGIPCILAAGRGWLARSWIQGHPMQDAAPRDAEYHSGARRLVARLHRAGVVHNDLAKEPNWLVTPEGRPALVDFQIALASRRRRRVFRWLAREDLRHVLKHKRKYLPEALTERELRWLQRPLPVTRVWRATAKRAYNVLTRRILHWTDSEGKRPGSRPRSGGPDSRAPE